MLIFFNLKSKKIYTSTKYYNKFADDGNPYKWLYYKWEWLLKAAYKRLIQELEKLGVKINIQKTQVIDLTRGQTFSPKFLGNSLKNGLIAGI